LSRAKLSGAYLVQANLTAAYLNGSDLGLASLRAANLDAVSAYHARFTAAELRQASLVGADLTDAVLTAARANGVNLWLAKPTAKENLSWIDLGGAVARAPEGAEAKNLADWLGMVIKDRNYFSVGELKKLLSDISSMPNPERAQNETWLEWSRLLARADDDKTYQEGYSMVVTDFACAVPEFAIALRRWLTNNELGYLWTSEPERPLPKTPHDPALDNLSGDYSTFGYSDYSQEIPMADPLPIWFDARPLLERLRSGKCETSMYADDEMLAALGRRAQANNGMPGKRVGAEGSN
jgi:hypothetical protein